MEWFEKYMAAKKFKNILNLGVYDARDIAGWFIDNNDQYENIYLIDNYDLPSMTGNPSELINTVYKKIHGKQNINFIIEDGNLIDYSKIDFDFAFFDGVPMTVVEKVMTEKPDSIFCLVGFFNSFSKTNEILEWIKNKKIYPFLYLRHTTYIYFTANKEKHAEYYEEASNINFEAFIKYQQFEGCRIVCPKQTKPFYEYQEQKL